MTTFAQEQSFRSAVAAAEATRQGAISAAFVAYGFNPANLATYLSAIVSAQTAYTTAVNSAASSNGLDPEIGRNVIPTNWARLAGN
jgi:hypothetical protein